LKNENATIYFLENTDCLMEYLFAPCENPDDLIFAAGNPGGCLFVRPWFYGFSVPGLVFSQHGVRLRRLPSVFQGNQVKLENSTHLLLNRSAKLKNNKKGKSGYENRTRTMRAGF
jgi:hypothetical protein